MSIGASIRAARKTAKLTQEQLAEKSGVAAITIRQYESGKRQPRIEQLQSLANALNISINEFLPAEKSPLDDVIEDETLQVYLDGIKKHLSLLNARGQEKISNFAIDLATEFVKIPEYQKAGRQILCLTVGTVDTVDYFL